jgi:hypothetical protein
VLEKNKNKNRKSQVFYIRRLGLMIKKAPERYRGLKKSNIIEVATMSKKDKNKNSQSQVFYIIK